MSKRGGRVVKFGPRDTPYMELSKEISKLTDEEQHEYYKSEENRLRSFGLSWPYKGKKSARGMAAAGFYYTGPGDKVTCSFCRTVLEKWSDTDNPIYEHMQKSNNCRFLKRLHGYETESVVQIERMDTSVYGSDAKIDRYGIDAAKPKLPTQPMFEEMSDKLARITSFNSWPRDSPVSVQQLVTAGFYNKGPGDKVQCFQCGLELYRWEDGDNAFLEHWKETPDCECLKGREFYIEQLRNTPRVQHMKETLRLHAESQGHSPAAIVRAFTNIGRGPFMTEDDLIDAILKL